MQTFMFWPNGNHVATASVLDDKRLGKQRVEALQIMTALYDPSYGWQNHPAVKMWRGHEWHLGLYQRDICHEWVVNRGFKDTCLDKTIDIMVAIENQIGYFDFDPPEWFSDSRVFHSHRANYNRKMGLDVNGQYPFPYVDPAEGYYWPAA